MTEPRGEQRPLLLQAFSSPAYGAMIADHAERHKAYAARHGYDYEAIDMAAQGIDYDGGWSRLSICKTAIDGGKWSHVFFLDADCIVVDPRRDMRETLPSWASYAYTIHPYPIAAHRASKWHWQAGMMYYRADARASMFLGQCLRAREHGCANDQHAINTLLMDNPIEYQCCLRTLYQQWNNTLHDEQPDETIVAAFHGNGNLEQRRSMMRQVAAAYPWTHEGYANLAFERLGPMPTPVSEE